MSRTLGQDRERFVKVGIVRSQEVYQSSLGRYFVGRTGSFPIPAGNESVVIFQNPADSNRRAFFTVVTITTQVLRRFLFYFDAQTPVQLSVSNNVANAHRGSPKLPKAQILSAIPAPSVPLEGVGLFEREVSGPQTLEIDQGGKFILDPGHNHAIRIPSVSEDDELDFAFGWWEEPFGNGGSTAPA